ncbi:MAG: CoA ester lyase [Ilumatobacteraceae bacterium]
MSSRNRLAPPRSYLYAPADRPDVVTKALSSGAHVVVIDLEDGLRDGDAAKARVLLRQFFEERSATTDETVDIHVRCSRAPDGPGWNLEDLAVAVTGRSAAIRLAKAENPDALAALDAELSRLESAAGVKPGTTVVFPLIESALGIVNAAEMARAVRVRGLCLGAADLSRDLGVDPSDDPQALDPLSTARGMLVIAARAAGLDGPIDSVCTNLAIAEATEAEARRARRLGFSGKSLIHPRQLQPIHRAFASTYTELERARIIAAAWDRAVEVGETTTVVNGEFVDAPIAARAEQILKDEMR